jgi:hypothetical protein
MFNFERREIANIVTDTNHAGNIVHMPKIGNVATVRRTEVTFHKIITIAIRCITE